MFRLHVGFVLCGSSTRCPWEYPAAGTLSPSWQPWCLGHYSVWKVRVRLCVCVCVYKLVNIFLIIFESLFSCRPASDIGSYALWPFGPYEDLPHYIRPAHCSDPAHTRDQSWGRQRGAEVEEALWVLWKFPQPTAVPLCECGRRSFLYPHSILLLHVRLTRKCYPSTQ